ncbi:unnamed protein product [Fraxinus pennsylvanica]|uniref:Uncharacterized protein n=1 Tax=Fraxinus pennsylvanica TaxID=56036 RepID=A0AAD2DL62_9LAMI|nr:unnamed protein product [Fraxinus pennsylvanica]
MRVLLVGSNVFGTLGGSRKNQNGWKEGECYHGVAKSIQGKQNQVADPLIRKSVEAYVSALMIVESDFLDKIKQWAEKDVAYTKLLQEIKDGVVRRCWIEDGLIYAKISRLYVLSGGGLRQIVLKETHDPLWAGHPGIERMLALLSKSTALAVDFYGFHFWFPEAPHECTMDGAVGLYLKNVVKYFGIPEDIVSNRNSRFTASQKNWVVLLDTDQFYYNLHQSSATGMCLAELTMRYILKTSLEIVKEGGRSVCLAAF